MCLKKIFVCSMSGWAILVSTTAASPAPAHANKNCPIEKAVYRLRGFENSATFRFVNDPELARQSHLSAVLKSKVTGRTYKYRFAASNGYAVQYLVAVTSKAKPAEDAEDNNNSLAFFMFNDALRQVGLPQLGESAPKFLFVPDLGPKHWYAEQPTPNSKRETIETELWSLSQCAP